jgi:hypothetical protein
MIKKIALLTTLCPALAWAEITAPKPWQHDFNLGIEAQHYHYEEPILDKFDNGDTTWMNQKGHLFGMSGSYRLTYQNMIFMQPEGRLLIGRERYESGFNEETRNYTKRTIKNLIAEPRLLIGRNFNFNPNVQISPYTGLGYRLKIDDAEKTVNIIDGTPRPYRKSNYVYIPVGSYLDVRVDDQWSFTISGEYDFLIKGWQYDRTPQQSPVEMKQKEGYGLKGEIKVSYQMEKFGLFANPYVYYWNIKQSKSAQYLGYGGIYYDTHEPHNTTLESGMRFGVSF